MNGSITEEKIQTAAEERREREKEKATQDRKQREASKKTKKKEPKQETEITEELKKKVLDLLLIGVREQRIIGILNIEFKTKI